MKTTLLRACLTGVWLLALSVAQAQQGFSFVALGDLPYGTPGKAYGPYRALIERINQAGPDFSVHVGDFKSGSTLCSDEEFANQRAHFQRFKAAVIYTPGDNEWADCHKTKQGGGSYNATTAAIDYVTTNGGSYAKGDPLANLSLVRSIFFPAPGKSLGANPMTVHSQALEYNPANPADAQFVENVWFEKNGVLFVTINVPGGSNNDLDPNGPSYLLWYKGVRDAKAPGGVRFTPEVIHNRSGVGSSIAVTDVDKDGASDIVTSGVHGTFVFLNKGAPAKK